MAVTLVVYVPDYGRKGKWRCWSMCSCGQVVIHATCELMNLKMQVWILPGTGIWEMLGFTIPHSTQNISFPGHFYPSAMSYWHIPQLWPFQRSTWQVKKKKKNILLKLWIIQNLEKQFLQYTGKIFKTDFQKNKSWYFGEGLGDSPSLLRSIWSNSKVKFVITYCILLRGQCILTSETQASMSLFSFTSRWC